MAHKFHGDFSKLESEMRKKILPAEEILRKLDIKEGSTIIDFGCGIGYFSIPASGFVGEDGKVIAIDSSDEMLAELLKRVKGRNNIEIVKSDSLKGYKGDMILLVNILHELDNPKEFFEASFLALNSGGRVIVIDWQKKATKMGPPVSHRLSKEKVIEMTGRPFVDHGIDDSLYFLEFGH